jgi:predicted ArsR family transcriptional regulator
MRVLRASPDPMTIVAIADKLDVHPNTVRYHLDGLVGGGLVERVEVGRGGPGRPPLLFQAVRRMDRGGTRNYRMLAEMLTMALASASDPHLNTKVAAQAAGRNVQAAAQAAGRNVQVAAQAAGRQWSAALSRLGSELESPAPFTSADEAIDCLVDALEALGFAPERRVSDEEQQIGMRHCPFLEVAENRTDVICQVHLGVIQGVVQAGEAPITAERLDAFVEPGLCLLHLKLISTND